MFLHNKTIVICVSSKNFKTCFKLQEGNWTIYNSLNYERTFAATVSTNNATFIFGGMDSKTKYTFEYLEKDAANWKLGKTNITGSFEYGCTIAISEEEIWLIGGLTPNEKRILSFNVRNQSFTEMPFELKLGRRQHQCAFIPGTRNIIVTGGTDYGYYLDSTQIINVDNGSVSNGARMNSKRCRHGIGILNINNQERIVIFGGKNDDDYLKTVEVYNTQAQNWELSNITLIEARESFGFLTIKSWP